MCGCQVSGVSFHVGSGAAETGVYARAIALCRALFSVGLNVGHARMHLVDVGGGFPGATHADLFEVCTYAPSRCAAQWCFI